MLRTLVSSSKSVPSFRIAPAEELSFLFSEANWRWHGRVNYRVSHGDIYCQGESTGLTDEDLIDTGDTWDAWTRSIRFDGENQA